MISNNWDYEGTRYTFSWIPNADTTNIAPITQCYGFCYNDSHELLVIQNIATGRWQVPGGTPEEGETSVKTLRRELVEEADVTIKDIKYLGAQRVSNNKNDQIKYQLRYACRIEKILEQTPDPDSGCILKRKFINPLLYPEMSGWGEVGRELVRLSMEKLEILS